MFPDIRKDDLTGFLALLAMLATSSKGFHSTSAPSNNFSKKVRLFFIVFFIVPRRVGFSPPPVIVNWWAKAHPTFYPSISATILSISARKRSILATVLRISALSSSILITSRVSFCSTYELTARL